MRGVQRVEFPPADGSGSAVVVGFGLAGVLCVAILALSLLTLHLPPSRTPISAARAETVAAGATGLPARSVALRSVYNPAGTWRTVWRVKVGDQANGRVITVDACSGEVVQPSL